MTFWDNFKSFVCKFNLEEGCRAALSYSRGKLNIHCHHRRTPGTLCMFCINGKIKDFTNPAP